MPKDPMSEFKLEGERFRRPVFMAGWAIDGRQSSKGDIRNLAKNTNRLIQEIGHVPPLNFGHMFCQPEEPTRGHIESVETEVIHDGKGKPMFALMANMFLHQETAELFKAGKFPKVSAEIALEINTHTGETLGPTLMGAALLGSSVPAFPQLFGSGTSETSLPMEFNVFFDSEHSIYKHTTLTPGLGQGKTRFSTKFHKIVSELFGLLSGINNPETTTKETTMAKEEEEKEMAEDSEGGADNAASLRKISAELLDMADNMDGGEAEPSEEDEAPEGESMAAKEDEKEEEDEKDFSSKADEMNKEQIAAFQKLEAENKALRAEVADSTVKASKAISDEAFASLVSMGRITQGQRKSFDTLVDVNGLDSAVATFTVGGGVDKPMNASPLDSPGSGHGAAFQELGELSEMEEIKMKSYKADGYEDSHIADLLSAGRKYKKGA